MCTQAKPPLSQGEGYGVIIGLGGAFALGKCSQGELRWCFTDCTSHCLCMIWATRAMKRSFNEDNSTTEAWVLYSKLYVSYMFANRSVGVGLTASAVISS